MVFLILLGATDRPRFDWPLVFRREEFSGGESSGVVPSLSIHTHVTFRNTWPPAHATGTPPPLSFGMYVLCCSNALYALYTDNGGRFTPLNFF